MTADRPLTRDISIKFLLVIGFLSAGLVPIMILSLMGFGAARTGLEYQAFRHLESVRNIKKVQIHDFFLERRRNILEFATNPHTVSAFKELNRAFFSAGGSKSGLFLGHLDEQYSAPAAYRKVHDAHFSHFKSLIRLHGFYDFFLLTPDTGETVFTVRKETDFGVSIAGGASSLKDVWQQAIRGDTPALSDTKPYSPSQGIPAQFLAAPILENGRCIGVAAVQISIDSIDEIMQERSGLWKTGETYLVGPDFKMRSDAYLDRSGHSVLASFRGTVEQNGVDTDSTRSALAGETGTKIIPSYRQTPVLSAYTPIEAFGLKWIILAEVEKNEIEAQIAAALNNRIILLFFLSAIILAGLSWLISTIFDRGIKRTTEQFTEMIRTVLSGNLDVRGEADSVGVDFKELVSTANRLIDAFARQLEERKRLEEHLLLSERLKAIGTLAGGIAHDFNNILTSLFALTHIVLTELPADHPSRETVQEMIASLRRASDLVEQILTFGRSTKTERRRMDIRQLTEETARMLRATFPKNITIYTDLCSSGLIVHAVPAQFNQILMNLCTNARQAMQNKGGDLKISLGHCPEGQTPGQRPGPYAKLTVADTGTGIDPAIINQIFDPFFSTKPEGQGCGMGLSIVHGIVMNIGGMIGVDSVLGQGSSFHVYLPLVAPWPQQTKG